jgi:hypothetical protein
MGHSAGSIRPVPTWRQGNGNRIVDSFAAVSCEGADRLAVSTELAPPSVTDSGLRQAQAISALSDPEVSRE